MTKETALELAELNNALIEHLVMDTVELLSNRNDSGKVMVTLEAWKEQRKAILRLEKEPSARSSLQQIVSVMRATAGYSQEQVEATQQNHPDFRFAWQENEPENQR